MTTEEMILELKNGSVIRMLGSDTPEKLEGCQDPLIFIIVDDVEENDCADHTI